MKLKELKEILIHYRDREYDDWDITLWDYNNQRELNWPSGTYSSSKSDKSITFPVSVEPVDGEEIDSRMKRLIAELNDDLKNETDALKKAIDSLKEVVSNLKNGLNEIQKNFDRQCNGLIKKLSC